MNKTEDDEVDAEELTEHELRQVAGACLTVARVVACQLSDEPVFLSYSDCEMFVWIKLSQPIVRAF